MSLNIDLEKHGKAHGLILEAAAGFTELSYTHSERLHWSPVLHVPLGSDHRELTDRRPIGSVGHASYNPTSQRELLPLSVLTERSLTWVRHFGP